MPLSSPPVSPFALPGCDNITREEHFGVKGFMATASVPHRDALAVRGFWAPPYASSDFMLEVRLDGETVPTGDYWWNGNECRREGRRPDLWVESAFVIAMHQRAAMLEFTVTNDSDMAVAIPLQFAIRGTVDEVSFWEFGGPGNEEANTPWAERANAWVCEGDTLIKRKDSRALVVATDAPVDRWETLCGHWEGMLTLAVGERRTLHVALSMGPAETAVAEARDLLVQGHEAVAAARDDWARQVADLFTRVPRLEASDPRLVKYYHRSLVGLLLNQWRVPEFVTNPYYSTGGINGGCVCCYLWDFGEPWEVLPLYDPEAVRAHIRQFLSVDITHHFAWVPTTGEAFGPWYPVNQEKIIHLIYYDVLLTGDVDFLHEIVAGRSVCDWVVYHATYRDNPALPVALIDYGKGNNHLELRGTYRYDHHLPDLNARRYANYLKAYELTKLAGQPAEALPARAAALKPLLRQFMWSPEHRWFHHLDENFAPGLCYNVQMFKFLDSEVLEDDQREGLLSHLNETEFLSRWGLHSMSKLDPAYDQVDIDNGGGGNYTAFTPRIVEMLYKSGCLNLAENILQRTLWWGERMPYWGDSIVANQIDYRQDTPLQNTIGAVAGAQMIIFGMFGVSVSPEGVITVNPQPPSFSPAMKLSGLRLRGRTLDIAVAGGQFTVTVDGQAVTAPLGTPVVVG